MLMGEKLRAQGLKGERLSEKFPVDDQVYACHGGGFPVRIKGVEGVVAAIVVSGLRQEDDHELLIKSVRWFLKKVENRV